ncbi:MAG: C4-type zinc ribbon domain-containing protein [Pseudomonadota bacterium]
MIDIKEQIEFLIKLQAIETERNKISLALAGVSEKNDRLDLKIKNSEDIVELKQSFIEDLRNKYKELEFNNQANISILSKSQGKLASVKTNKEYQSVLKEIDDIKLKNSDIEEEILKTLEAIDTAENEILELNKEFLQIKETINGQKAIINKEAEQNREGIVSCDEKWNNISKNVATEIMSKYNMVREFIKDTAIAPTIDSICQGCNMNIPPQMYNELLRFDSIKYCPHCQRIIYWGKT